MTTLNPEIQEWLIAIILNRRKRRRQKKAMRWLLTCGQKVSNWALKRLVTPEVPVYIRRMATKLNLGCGDADRILASLQLRDPDKDVRRLVRERLHTERKTAWG